MKKFCGLVIALVVVMSACAAFAKPDDVIKIKLAAQATSGQVFQYLAEERGYLKDEGIDVQMVYINNGTDAFSALSSGQVDVISTYGTGGPLIQIVNGQPFTIFGGYMIIGETPVYGLPETEYKGLESFKGKKIAIMRGGTPDIVLKGILYDAGLLDQVTFVELKKNTDVLQAIMKKEVDFGSTSTGFQVQARQWGLEVKMWPDEVWKLHSCCRMLSKTSWLENNNEALYRLIRAYLRAEEDMQDEMPHIVDLIVEKLDIAKETAESFVLSPHMIYDTDPYKNSVFKMWDKMSKFGYLPKDPSIKLEDHMNTAIYLKALESLIKDYPDNAFYKAKLEQFNKNNI
ncbi:MAG: ABC transporter substrate-binding protein [Synergistaceae bacterium]|nr:ABC transporter substrate-binding protein [Synergistaceae bacterium]